MELHGSAGKELYVAGGVSANVANEYTAFTRRGDGLYDVMVSLANYSDEEVSCDVSLYDDEQYDKKMIALASMSLSPSESRVCFFEAVDWRGGRSRPGSTRSHLPAVLTTVLCVTTLRRQ